MELNTFVIYFVLAQATGRAHVLLISFAGHAKSEHCGQAKDYTFSDSAQLTQGSSVALNGQYPWMVSLGKKLSNDGWMHVCGGTIIGRSSILTAAHCKMITK